MTEGNPGPTAKGKVSRNVKNLDQVYVRSGVILAAPQNPEEEAAVDWWQSLGPDGRLLAIVQMCKIRVAARQAMTEDEDGLGHA